MTKRTTSTLIGVALVALAIGSTTVAQGESPVRGEAQPTTNARLPAIAMFRALRGPAAVLPPAIARGVSTRDDYGLDPTQAVAVRAPSAEQRDADWYLVPGEKGVCLEVGDRGVCSTYEQLRENGTLWFATWGKNPKGVSTDDPESEQAWVVRGIAADSVAALTVTGKGRGTTGFAKTNDGGAFYLDLPHGGDAVTLEDDHGKAIQRQQVGAEPAEG